MQFTHELSSLLFAILNKRLDIKCLHLKKTLVNYSDKNKVCDIACQIGDLSLLMCAQKNGCEFDLNITLVAAVGGHLSLLKYVHEIEPFIWHPKTTYVAAKHGHLSCLKYACKHKCPWDPMTVFAAIKNKHIDCIKYANEVHLMMIESPENEDFSIDKYDYKCKYSSDYYKQYQQCIYDYKQEDTDKRTHHTYGYTDTILDRSIFVGISDNCFIGNEYNSFVGNEKISFVGGGRMMSSYYDTHGNYIG